MHTRYEVMTTFWRTLRKLGQENRLGVGEDLHTKSYIVGSRLLEDGAPKRISGFPILGA